MFLVWNSTLCEKMSWQQMDKGGNWSFPILDRPAVSVWTGNRLCNDDFLHNIAEINEKACVLFKSFRCFSIPLFFNYNVCFYQDRSGSYFFCGPVGFFQSNSVFEAFHIIIVVVFILFFVSILTGVFDCEGDYQARPHPVPGQWQTGVL